MPALDGSLSPDEAALLLGFSSVAGVYKLIRQNRLKYKRYRGRLYEIDPTSVAEYQVNRKGPGRPKKNK